MRSTKGEPSETDNAIKNGGVTFGSDFYTWGAAVRKYSSSAWSEDASGASNYLVVGSGYIFNLKDGARVQRKATGGSWENAGVDSNPPTDMKIATIHGGYMWFAEDGNSFVHYAQELDLSDLEGDGKSDTNVIVVGPGGLEVKNMISFANALYVARADGLWVVNQDGEFNARQVLNFSAETHEDNFRSMVVFQGALYFPIRHRIYRWTGSTIVDVTPQRIDDTFPFIQYGEYDNFISRGAYMYCTARTDQANDLATESILAYDGMGWHRMLDPITSAASDSRITMLALDPANDYIWYHTDTSSDATKYIVLRDKSEFPAKSFTTSGSHFWFSSIHDMGFRKVTKSLRSITFETDNCASNRTITVTYSLDGATFTSDDLSSDGIINADTFTTLTFDDTKEFKNIQFRFAFNAQATSSPVLKSYSLKYMMRPDTAYGYVFDIIAASGSEYGGGVDDRTAAQIMTDLETVRASTAPVAFVNLLGESKKVYLASLTEAARSRADSNPELPDVEHRVRVSLVET
jgi:hypothetical protein